LASLWALLGAVLVASPAAAQIRQYHYYVAPAPLGSDEGDCAARSKPCATFQRAVDSCPSGGHCFVEVAPGIYSQKTNVFYYKVVTFDGRQNAEGECSDRGAVVVDDRVNGIGQTGLLFWAQDHTVLTIRCMTLKAYASGSTGFASRQFAIGDVVDVNFAQFPSGLGVSAAETSKINVLNPGILGNASRFAMATDLSQVTVGGEVMIGDKLSFDVAFFSSLFGSVISVYPSAVAGGDAMSGASYECLDSRIRRTITLPGGDVPYPGNANCGLSGLSSDNKVAVNDGPTAMNSAFDNEIIAVRKGFDNELRVTRHRIYAAIAILGLIVSGGGTFAWLLYGRQRKFAQQRYSTTSSEVSLAGAREFPASVEMLRNP